MSAIAKIFRDVLNTPATTYNNTVCTLALSCLGLQRLASRLRKPECVIGNRVGIPTHYISSPHERVFLVKKLNRKIDLEVVSRRVATGSIVHQLHSIDWQDRSAELGLGFAKVSDRGKGYGTNALQLIVSYAFDHLGLHRLAANPVASIKVLSRIYSILKVKDLFDNISPSSSSGDVP